MAAGDFVIQYFSLGGWQVVIDPKNILPCEEIWERVKNLLGKTYISFLFNLQF